VTLDQETLPEGIAVLEEADSHFENLRLRSKSL
jgi:hypothetical protein